MKKLVIIGILLIVVIIIGLIILNFFPRKKIQLSPGIGLCEKDEACNWNQQQSQCSDAREDVSSQLADENDANVVTINDNHIVILTATKSSEESWADKTLRIRIKANSLDYMFKVSYDPIGGTSFTKNLYGPTPIPGNSNDENWWDIDIDLSKLDDEEFKLDSYQLELSPQFGQLGQFWIGEVEFLCGGETCISTCSPTPFNCLDEGSDGESCFSDYDNTDGICISGLCVGKNNTIFKPQLDYLLSKEINAEKYYEKTRLPRIEYGYADWNKEQGCGGTKSNALKCLDITDPPPGSDSVIGLKCLSSFTPFQHSVSLCCWSDEKLKYNQLTGKYECYKEGLGLNEERKKWYKENIAPEYLVFTEDDIINCHTDLYGTLSVKNLAEDKKDNAINNFENNKLKAEMIVSDSEGKIWDKETVSCTPTKLIPASSQDDLYYYYYSCDADFNKNQNYARGEKYKCILNPKSTNGDYVEVNNEKVNFDSEEIVSAGYIYYTLTLNTDNTGKFLEQYKAYRQVSRIDTNIPLAGKLIFYNNFLKIRLSDFFIQRQTYHGSCNFARELFNQYLLKNSPIYAVDAKKDRVIVISPDFISKYETCANDNLEYYANQLVAAPGERLVGLPASLIATFLDSSNSVLGDYFVAGQDAEAAINEGSASALAIPYKIADKVFFIADEVSFGGLQKVANLAVRVSKLSTVDIKTFLGSSSNIPESIGVANPYKTVVFISGDEKNVLTLAKTMGKSYYGLCDERTKDLYLKDFESYKSCPNFFPACCLKQAFSEKAINGLTELAKIKTGFPISVAIGQLVGFSKINNLNPCGNKNDCEGMPFNYDPEDPTNSANIGNPKSVMGNLKPGVKNVYYPSIAGAPLN